MTMQSYVCATPVGELLGLGGLGVSTMQNGGLLVEDAQLLQFCTILMKTMEKFVFHNEFVFC